VGFYSDRGLGRAPWAVAVANRQARADIRAGDVADVEGHMLVLGKLLCARLNGMAAPLFFASGTYMRGGREGARLDRWGNLSTRRNKEQGEALV
jgi:hypothetical protein